MITFLLGLHLESYSEWLDLYAQRSCTTSTTQTIRKEQRYADKE